MVAYLEKKQRPTCYSGVFFKSEAEAILARCFDLFTERNRDSIQWVYKPEQLRDGDWVPCFYIVINDNSKKGMGAVARSIVIEYKPMPLNFEETSQIFKHFRNLHERKQVKIDENIRKLHERFPKIEFNILHGGAYTNPPGRIIFEVDPLDDHSLNFTRDPDAWLSLGISDRILLAARDYRYNVEST